MQRTAVAFYRVVSPAVETKCTFISALLHTQTATNTQTQVTHAYRRVECTHTISPYVHEDIRGMLPGAGIGRNEAWLARCCTALWKPGPNKYKKNNAKKKVFLLCGRVCMHGRWPPLRLAWSGRRRLVAVRAVCAKRKLQTFRCNSNN